VIIHQYPLDFIGLETLSSAKWASYLPTPGTFFFFLAITSQNPSFFYLAILKLTPVLLNTAVLSRASAHLYVAGDGLLFFFDISALRSFSF
jgi:hypothetical protein